MEIEYIRSLKELREQLNLSQRQLADAANCTQGMISQTERMFPNIKFNTLLNYIGFLGGNIQLMISFGDKAYIIKL